ncbi:MAG TPA: tetratricopeptide repeat protein [Cytophagaceae bacterium]|jgi:hypothetical protein
MKALLIFLTILCLNNFSLFSQDKIAHDKAITTIIFSEDNTLLISAGKDKVVRVWDNNSGKMIHALNHKFYVNKLLLSPDKKYLITSVNDSTYHCVWDLTNGKNIKCLIRHRALAFTPDSKNLLVLSREKNEKLATLGLINMQDYTRTFFKDKIEGDDVLENLTFAPSGKKMYLANNSRYIKVFDLTSPNTKGKKKVALPGRRILYTLDQKYYLLEGYHYLFDSKSDSPTRKLDSLALTGSKISMMDKNHLRIHLKDRLHILTIDSNKISRRVVYPRELHGLSGDAKWFAITYRGKDLSLVNTTSNAPLYHYEAADIVEKTAYNNYLRGVYYFKNKNYQKSIEYFQMAEGLSARNDKLYLVRGQARLYLGQYDEAIRDLLKDNEISPARPYLHLAIAHVKKGETSNGIKYIELNQQSPFREPFNRLAKDTALAKAKTDPYWSSYINANISSSSESERFIAQANDRANSKDMIGAIEYMNKAVSAAPDFAEPYKARSELYLKMYQYDNAIEDLKNVMRINTNDYLDLYLQIAKALSMKGENGKTIALLEECINVDPTNFDLYLDIADLQMAQYKREDALEAINSYIDIIPDNSYAYYLRANIHRDQKLVKEDINMAIDLCKESGKEVPKEYYNLLSTTN